MKKLFSILPLFALLIVSSGCGLSVWQDMMAARGNRVLIGGGAYPGADYVTGLKPSVAAKQYFAQVPDNAEPLETVHRKDAGRSKSGVRFLANGGILIPPGVVISYENKGCCMDPSLPTPKAGDEYQLVPVERLLPAEMQDLYQKLMLKAANGDQAVQLNLQYLVWALRTAGTDHPIANSLSKTELSILDRCGYSGQFSAFHANAKANKDLNDLANALVSIGTVSYSADDLRNSGNALERINEHLEQLMQIGANMPTSHTGFNFGELEPGIYTDIRGTGYLTFTARIANSTGQDFIFYPSNYAGQVGSGVNDKGMAFFATANDGKKQRVTLENPKKLDIQNGEKNDDDEENKEKEEECKYCSSEIAFRDYQLHFQRGRNEYERLAKDMKQLKSCYKWSTASGGIIGLMWEEKELKDRVEQTLRYYNIYLHHYDHDYKYVIGSIGRDQIVDTVSGMPFSTFLSITKYVDYCVILDGALEHVRRDINNYRYKCIVCGKYWELPDSRFLVAP